MVMLLLSVRYSGLELHWSSLKLHSFDSTVFHSKKISNLYTTDIVELELSQPILRASCYFVFSCAYLHLGKIRSPADVLHSASPMFGTPSLVRAY